MNNRTGVLKIVIGAAFFLLFGAAFFLSPVAKISAVRNGTDDAENPQNCAACHQADYDSWHRTSHRKTVEKANAENVRGDFTKENRLESADFRAEMKRDGADFFIKIGDDSYKIAAVVGVNYIEQYVGEKEGEFYSLPIGYNLTEKRWIHLNDADFAGKDAEFSRHLQNWKADCAACHQPNQNQISGDFEDFGVSCNSCHGNAAEHLASKTSIWAKIGFQTENKIGNPKDLSSDASMLVCASCHSRELVAAHNQNDFDPAKFWANGEPKFSGNEFPAIVRSVCYAQSKAGGHGISGEKINCASCHSQHETSVDFAVPKTNQDQNCISCHAQFSDGAAIVEHTKHPLDSEASSCASCHQPETVFGRTRFTRTHEISVPNPLLTVEKQIPNACNVCHIDQSVNWAVASSKKLWTERFRDAETSPDAQFDQPEAVRLLLSNDAFLRALAANSIKKHSVSSKGK